VLLNEPVAVVQGGVQLMNYQSKWYSVLNVLEYFFWFKSRLHYHARLGMTPLGGNTVFFTREVLERVGGWDEQDLTEDADIGIRISLLGERMRVIYDDRYVTREETPPTLSQFIKQRTRWSQGFLQTLLKGEWRRLPRLGQRLLAVYTLGFPAIQAVLGFYILASLIMMFTVKTPVLMAITLDLPFYLLAAHFILNVIGLYEFTSAHGLKPTWKTPLVMALGYLPYQWVLAYASVRATLRQVRGINNWEKTQHIGAHRQERAVPQATGEQETRELEATSSPS
jgi:cellulose synthase/poly-beta-1,6-N-acetylglucosamine synthase-like glycosyltransferase